MRNNCPCWDHSLMWYDSSNLAQRLQNLGRTLLSLLGHNSIMNLPHYNLLLYSKHFRYFYTSYTNYISQHNIMPHGRGIYLRQRTISEDVDCIVRSSSSEARNHTLQVLVGLYWGLDKEKNFCAFCFTEYWACCIRIYYNCQRMPSLSYVTVT